MASPPATLFGYATDAETGEPLYSYKPSLAGAPWQFRLTPDAGIGGVNVNGLAAFRPLFGTVHRKRQSAPIVGRHVSPLPDSLSENRRRQDALRQAGILVIARFPGADRMLTGDQQQFVGGRKLHHLTRRQ